MLILILLLTSLGIYNAKLLEDTYIDTLSERLQKEAMIISHSFDWSIVNENKKDRFQALVGKWSNAGEARVTVINIDGEVLADSDLSSDIMENHRTREEIERALTGDIGVAVRHSKSTGVDQLYVAVPLYNEEQLLGVVRLSYPIQLAETKVHKLWLGQIATLILAFILFSVIGSQIAKGFTRPIEKITEIARNITKQNFGTKVKVKGKGELADLAQAINYMSHSLEQQLKHIHEEEKKLSDVLTNLVSGVLLINPVGTVVLANRMAGQMIGISTQSNQFLSYSNLITDVTLKQCIDQIFMDKKEIREELHLYYPDEKIIDASLAPLFDGDGEFVGVVIVLHDLTEIRRLEKVRSDFVANASHELKTPVTSIKGFSETLLDGALDEKETLKAFLEIIHTESERLERLIRDILDLSRIEQKRLSLEYKRCKLFHIVEEISQSLQVQLERKSLEFSNEIPQDLELDADPDRLKQIFINLIINAIAFTPEKGRIWVATSEEQNRITIEVSDTGLGIPKQEMHRIFERFYRVDKARSRNSGGTGLGLAIVKHLVESHHGSIWVKSEEGRGTQFFIELSKEKV